MFKVAYPLIVKMWGESSHFSFPSVYCCHCLSRPTKELWHDNRFTLAEFHCQSRYYFDLFHVLTVLFLLFIYFFGFVLGPFKCQCEMCHLFNLSHRSIRCLRNIIHWNLITTFILRNVMWFLLQLIDHNIHESNEVTTHQTKTLNAKPLAHFLNNCYWLAFLLLSSALVSLNYDNLQLFRGDQLLLDVCRGLLPSHRHRDDLLNRQTPKVGLSFHRLVWVCRTRFTEHLGSLGSDGSQFWTVQAWNSKHPSVKNLSAQWKQSMRWKTCSEKLNVRLTRILSVRLYQQNRPKSSINALEYTTSSYIQLLDGHKCRRRLSGFNHLMCWSQWLDYPLWGRANQCN